MENKRIKQLTIIFGSIILLMSIPVLLNYIYLFILGLDKSRLMFFNPDYFFSNWIFLGLLIYASVLTILKKSNANYYFQFAFIGLIVENLLYHIICGSYVYPNYVAITCIFLLFILNFKKVINANNWEQISKIQYFRILIVDVIIVFFSILLFLIIYN